MKNRLAFLLRYLLWWLLPLGGCVEPYAPAAISAPPRLLVVDGFLNARGVSTIRLSRTASLATKDNPPAEIKATLFIETQNQGPRYALTETTPGTYSSANLTLDATRQYRLRISTAAGRQYASDFVPVKLTEPLDAVSWKPENNGVSVFVSTHDDARNSQYYRWEYDVTWEIRSPYRAILEYDKKRDSIIDIRVPFPFVCWSNQPSNRILISKTTALNQDVVADFRVQTLPSDAPALFSRYSILVRQQALTQPEYAYWELLRKNTENIGSLFDPQPSQVTGNVHNLDNPNDPVLGFVGAHSVTEKRLFIAQSELPSGWGQRSGYESCIPPDTIFFQPRNAPPDPLPDYKSLIYGAFASGANWPLQLVTPPGAKGFTLAKIDCIDCRTRGTAVRPSFW